MRRAVAPPATCGIQQQARQKPVAIVSPAKPRVSGPVHGYPLRSMRTAAKQIRKELRGLDEDTADYRSALRVLRTQALRVAAVADELLAQVEKAGNG